MVLVSEFASKKVLNAVVRMCRMCSLEFLCIVASRSIISEFVVHDSTRHSEAKESIHT